MHATPREIVILSLFTVRNDWRATGFKPLFGVSNRILIETCKVRILTVAFCDSLDQINGSWDTPKRLRGYGDWRAHDHIYRRAQA